MALSYTIGFKADTSEITTAINAIEADINSAFANSGSQMTENVSEGIRQATVLSDALKKAQTVDGTSFASLNASLKAAGTSAGEMVTKLQSAGMNSSVNTLLTQFAAADRQILSVNSKLAEMQRVLGQSIKFNLAMSFQNEIVQNIQSAVSWVQDLDTALHDIAVVAPSVGQDMEALGESILTGASNLRVAADEYAEAALIFYQQGLSQEDVDARTEYTIMAAKASGTAVEEMSSQLTAIWNTYQMEGEEMGRAASVAAELGAKTAASFSDIADGMQIAASGASMLGVSYDSLAAIMSTVVSVTQQSSSTVATAYKTIFARFSNLSTSGEDAGESLGAITQSLADMGINVLDSSGSLKDLDLVIQECGESWDSYSRNQQIAIAQTVGGTRQYQQFLALMQNYDEYLSNLEIAESTVDTSALEQQYLTAIDTIDTAVTQSSEAWNEAFGQMFDTDTQIGFYNTLEGIGDEVGVVIDTLGGLEGILLVAASILSAKIIPSLYRGGVEIKTWVQNFTLAGAQKQISSEIDGMTTALQNLQSTQNNANLGAQNNLAVASRDYKAAAEQLKAAKADLTTIQAAGGDTTAAKAAVEQAAALERSASATKAIATAEAKLVSENQANLDTYSQKLTISTSTANQIATIDRLIKNSSETRKQELTYLRAQIETNQASYLNSLDELSANEKSVASLRQMLSLEQQITQESAQRANATPDANGDLPFEEDGSVQVEDQEAKVILKADPLEVETTPDPIPVKFAEEKLDIPAPEPVQVDVTPKSKVKAEVDKPELQVDINPKEPVTPTLAEDPMPVPLTPGNKVEAELSEDPLKVPLASGNKIEAELVENPVLADVQGTMDQLDTSNVDPTVGVDGVVENLEITPPADPVGVEVTQKGKLAPVAEDTSTRVVQKAPLVPESEDATVQVKQENILAPEVEDVSVVLKEEGDFEPEPETVDVKLVQSGDFIPTAEDVKVNVSQKAPIETKATDPTVVVIQEGEIQTKATTPSVKVTQNGVLETKATTTTVKVDQAAPIGVKTEATPVQLTQQGSIETKATDPTVTVMQEGELQTKATDPTVTVAQEGILEVKTSEPVSVIVTQEGVIDPKVNTGTTVITQEGILDPDIADAVTRVKQAEILVPEVAEATVIVKQEGVLEVKTTTPTVTQTEAVATQVSDTTAVITQEGIIDTKATSPSVVITQEGVIDTKATDPSVVVTQENILQTEAADPTVTAQQEGELQTKAADPTVIAQQEGEIVTKATDPAVIVTQEGEVQTKASDVSVTISQENVLETEATDPSVKVTQESPIVTKASAAKATVTQEGTIATKADAPVVKVTQEGIVDTQAEAPTVVIAQEGVTKVETETPTVQVKQSGTLDTKASDATVKVAQKDPITTKATDATVDIEQADIIQTLATDEQVELTQKNQIDTKAANTAVEVTQKAPIQTVAEPTSTEVTQEGTLKVTAETPQVEVVQKGTIAPKADQASAEVLQKEIIKTQASDATVSVIQDEPLIPQVIDPTVTVKQEGVLEVKTSVQPVVAQTAVKVETAKAELGQAETIQTKATDVSVDVDQSEVIQTKATDVVVKITQESPIQTKATDAVVKITQESPIQTKATDEEVLLTQQSPIDTQASDEQVNITQRAPIDTQASDEQVNITQQSPIDTQASDEQVNITQRAPIDTQATDKQVAVTQKAPIDTQATDKQVNITQKAPIQTEATDVVVNVIQKAPIDTQATDKQVAITQRAPIETQAEPATVEVKQSGVLEADVISDDVTIDQTAPLKVELATPKVVVTQEGILDTKATSPKVIVTQEGTLETKATDPTVQVIQESILEVKTDAPQVIVTQENVLEVKTDAPSVQITQEGVIDTKADSPTVVVTQEQPIQTKASDAVANVTQKAPLQVVVTEPSVLPTQEGILETKATDPSVVVTQEGILEVKTSSVVASPKIEVVQQGIIETKATSPSVEVKQTGVLETEATDETVKLTQAAPIETEATDPSIIAKQSNIIETKASNPEVVVTQKGILEVKTNVPSLDLPDSETVEVKISGAEVTIKQDAPIETKATNPVVEVIQKAPLKVATETPVEVEVTSDKPKVPTPDPVEVQANVEKSSIDALKTDIKEIQAWVDAAKKTITEMGGEFTNASGPIQKIAEEVKKVQENLNGVSGETKETNSDMQFLGELIGEIERYAKQIKLSGLDTNQSSAALSQLQSKVHELVDSSEAAGSELTGTFTAAFNAISEGADLTTVTSKNGELSTAIEKVGASAGWSKEQIESLRNGLAAYGKAADEAATSARALADSKRLVANEAKYAATNMQMTLQQVSSLAGGLSMGAMGANSFFTAIAEGNMTMTSFLTSLGQMIPAFVMIQAPIKNAVAAIQQYQEAQKAQIAISQLSSATTITEANIQDARNLAKFAGIEIDENATAAEISQILVRENIITVTESLTVAENAKKLATLGDIAITEEMTDAEILSTIAKSGAGEASERAAALQLLLSDAKAAGVTVTDKMTTGEIKQAIATANLAKANKVLATSSTDVAKIQKAAAGTTTTLNKAQALNLSTNSKAIAQQVQEAQVLALKNRAMNEDINITGLSTKADYEAALATKGLTQTEIDGIKTKASRKAMAEAEIPLRKKSTAADIEQMLVNVSSINVETTKQALEARGITLAENATAADVAAAMAAKNKVATTEAECAVDLQKELIARGLIAADAEQLTAEQALDLARKSGIATIGMENAVLMENLLVEAGMNEADVAKMSLSELKQACMAKEIALTQVDSAEDLKNMLIQEGLTAEELKGKSVTELLTLAKEKKIAMTVAEGSSLATQLSLEELQQACLAKGIAFTNADTVAELTNKLARDANNMSLTDQTIKLIGNAKAWMVKNAAMLTTLGTILAVVAAIAAVLAIIHLFSESTISAAEKVAALNSAGLNLSDALDEASEAVSTLKTQLDTLAECEDTMSTLAKGTDEWTEALKSANEAALEILTTYPELYNIEGAVTRTEDGLIQISEEALNAAEEMATLAETQASLALQINNQQTRDANMTLDGVNMGAAASGTDADGVTGIGDAFSVESGEAALVAGTFAAYGALIGSAIPVLGTAVGAIAGAVVGFVAGNAMAEAAQAENNEKFAAALEGSLEDFTGNIDQDRDTFEAALKDAGMDTNYINEQLAAFDENHDAMMELKASIEANTEAKKLENEISAANILGEEVSGNEDYGSEAISAAGRLLSDSTDAAYSEILKTLEDDAAFGDTKEQEAAFAEYARLQGLEGVTLEDFNLNETVDYTDAEGNTVNISNEEIAAVLAAAQAMEELGTSSEYLISTFETLAGTGDSADAALLDFLGDMNMTDISKDTYENMVANIDTDGEEGISTEEMKTYMAVELGIDPENEAAFEQAALDLGYTSGDAMAEAMIEELEEVGDTFDELSATFGGAIAEIESMSDAELDELSLKLDGKDAADELAKLEENMADLGVEGAKALNNSLNEAMSKGMGVEGAAVMASGINDMLEGIDWTDDMEDYEVVLERIANTDWTDANAGNDLINMFDTLGVTAGMTDEEIQAFCESMLEIRQVSPLDEFKDILSTLQSMASITQDVGFGDIISEEDYQTLIATNAALKDAFMLTADGYQLVKDIDLTESLGAEEALQGMIDASEAYHEFNNADWHYENADGDRTGDVDWSDFAEGEKNAQAMADTLENVLNFDAGGDTNILENMGLSTEAVENVKSDLVYAQAALASAEASGTEEQIEAAQAKLDAVEAEAQAIFAQIDEFANDSTLEDISEADKELVASLTKSYAELYAMKDMIGDDAFNKAAQVKIQADIDSGDMSINDVIQEYLDGNITDETFEGSMSYALPIAIEAGEVTTKDLDLLFESGVIDKDLYEESMKIAVPIAIEAGDLDASEVAKLLEEGTVTAEDLDGVLDSVIEDFDDLNTLAKAGAMNCSDFADAIGNIEYNLSDLEQALNDGYLTMSDYQSLVKDMAIEEIGSESAYDEMVNQLKSYNSEDIDKVVGEADSKVRIADSAQTYYDSGNLSTENLEKYQAEAAYAASKAEALEDAIEQVAAESILANKAADTLTTTFEDYGTILAKGVANTGKLEDAMEDWELQDYAEGMALLKDNTADLLGIASDDLPAAFFESAENLALIEEAAAGSETALAALRDIASDTILIEAIADLDLAGDYTYEDVVAMGDELQSWLDSQDLGFGATLDIDTGSTEDTLNSFISAANMTVDEAQSYFDTLGYVPTIEMNSGTYDVPLETTVTEGEKPVYDYSTYTNGAGEEVEVPYVKSQRTTTYVESAGTKTIEVNAPTILPQDASNFSSDAQFSVVSLTKKSSSVSSSNGSSAASSSGSGSSSSSSSPDLTTSKSTASNRYKDNNTAIDSASRALEKLDTIESNSVGQTKLNAYAAKTAALQKQAKAYTALINEAQEYYTTDDGGEGISFGIDSDGVAVELEGVMGDADRLQQKLDMLNSGIDTTIITGTYTAEFDEDGFVTNAQEIMEGMYEEANAFFDTHTDKTWNSDDEAWEFTFDTESNKAAYEAIISQIESIDEQVASVEDTAQQVLDAIQSQLDLIFDWMANKIAEAQYKVELRVKLNDLDIKIVESTLDRLGDEQYTTTINFLTENAESTLSTAAALKEEWERYNEIVNNINAEENQEWFKNEFGDEAWEQYLENGTIPEDVFTAMEENIDNLWDVMDQLYEYNDQVWATWSDALDVVADDFDNLLGKFDSYSSQLESWQTIWEIAGDPYADASVSIDLMNDGLEVQASLMKSMQVEYDSLVEQLASTESLYALAVEANGADSQIAQDYLTTIEELEQEILDSKTDLLSETASYLEALEEAAEASAEVIVSAFTTALDGLFADLESAASMLDQYTTIDTYYATDTDAASSIYSMLDEVQTAMANTTDPTQYAEYAAWEEYLSSMIEEKTVQMEIMGEMQEVTIQTTKDGVELTETELAIMEAEFELMKTQAAWEEAQANKDTMRSVRDASGNYSYVYSADEEEEDTTASDINAQLAEIMSLHEQAADEAGEMWLSTMEAYRDYVAEIDWQRYEEDSAYKDEIDQRCEWYEDQMDLYADTIETHNSAINRNFEDTALGVILDIDDMADANDYYKENTAEMSEALQENYIDYQEQASESLEEIGIDTEELADVVETESDNIMDDCDETTEAVEEMAETSSEYLGEIESAIEEWGSTWATQCEETIAWIEATIEAYRNMLAEMNGDNTGEYDASTDYTAQMYSQISSGSIDADDWDDTMEGLYNKVQAANGEAEWTGTDSELSAAQGNYVWEEGMSQSEFMAANDLLSGSEMEDLINDADDLMTQIQSGTDVDKVSDAINTRYTKLKALLWAGAIDEDTSWAQEDYALLQDGKEAFQAAMWLKSSFASNEDEAEEYANTYATGGLATEPQVAVVAEEGKELILNPADTENMLLAIEIMRDSIAQYLSGLGSSQTTTINTVGETTTSNDNSQQIIINAEFPNVSARDEIEAAFSNMVNEAAQYQLK